MDCDSFHQLGSNDTQNYTYTYPSTRPDAENDPTWTCSVWYYDQYYDWLTEAATESCYTQNYADYWCAYNITSIFGDEINLLDCSAFYDYNRYWGAVYRN